MNAYTAPLAAAAPPLHLWWTPGRALALRLAVALAFLAGLGTALALLAPPPAGPQVRLALPPPLPDPAALLPYLPETARAANAAVPIIPPTASAAPFRLAAQDTGAEARALENTCLTRDSDSPTYIFSSSGPLTLSIKSIHSGIYKYEYISTC